MLLAYINRCVIWALRIPNATVFLNKYDLLARKLKSGVKVKKYLSSFGDRENSAAVLAKCASSVSFLRDRGPHRTETAPEHRLAPKVPRPAQGPLAGTAIVLWLRDVRGRACFPEYATFWY